MGWKTCAQEASVLLENAQQPGGPAALDSSSRDERYQVGTPETAPPQNSNPASSVIGSPIPPGCLRVWKYGRVAALCRRV